MNRRHFLRKSPFALIALLGLGQTDPEFVSPWLWARQVNDQLQRLRRDMTAGQMEGQQLRKAIINQSIAIAALYLDGGRRVPRGLMPPEVERWQDL